MQLKNRSHVATQTSLEEVSRQEEQVYDANETGHSKNNLESGGGGGGGGNRHSVTATVEREMTANELETADIEIIDNDESGKED